MTDQTLADPITNTSIEPLSAIKVGIIDEEDGAVLDVITLEELVRTANSQEIWMRNFAGFGEVEFELTVSNSDNLVNKVAYWRNQQRKEKGESRN